MSQKTKRRLLVTGHDAKGRSCVASGSVMEGSSCGISAFYAWLAHHTLGPRVKPEDDE